MDLQGLKQYLIDLNYPNINILSIEQVADVFNADNRRFLVIWLIKQIGEFEIPADKARIDKYLADVIHEHGFCKTSQKLKFVTGDKNLAAAEQLTIIITMFEYIKSIQNINVPVITTPLSTEELKLFRALDVNLVPSFVSKKNITEDQRRVKFESYEVERAKLRAEIDALRLELDGEKLVDRVGCGPDVEAVRASFCDFKDVSRNILSFDRQDQVKVGFGEEFAERAAGCQREITLVSEYMKNICDISKCNEKFEKASLDSYKTDEDKESAEFIEMAAELSNKLEGVSKDKH